MTAVDTLVRGMNATHGVLAERLARASAARPDPFHARDQFPATDTFLASASRHIGAICAVVVPAVRHRLDDGQARAREFVEASKRFELALAQVKAKLYGSSYAVRRTWDSVWDDVRQEFDAIWELERDLVTDLAASRLDTDPDWGEELYHAELHAPTRPHPYVPHQGVPGKLARSVALRVDRFWDSAEGRMVPEPIHHHDRSHDGKFAQYFLADPHLPDDED
jgi:hypothetical protein